MAMQNGHEDLQMVSGKAEELVTLALEVCEKHLSTSPVLSPEQEALSSAAMTVRQSVKTFLAVTGDTGGG